MARLLPFSSKVVEPTYVGVILSLVFLSFIISSTTIQANNKASSAISAAAQRHRSLSSQVVQDFKPLTCDQAMEGTCGPWTTAVTTMFANGWMTIPCHKCVTMDVTDGSVVTVNGGLQIQGKLIFPNESKVILRTKLIVVEGELEMISNDLVGSEPKVTIQMIDDETVDSFVPHTSNNNACGGAGSACVVGKQAIVVAGGKLNIRGLPPNCPSWSTISKTVSGPMPIPTSHVLTAPTGSSNEGCDPTGIIFKETFSNTNNFNGWHGNLGTKREITNIDSYDEANYLKISNRKMSWQGPYYELSHTIRNCLSADQSYHFRSKLRLTRGINGIPSLCTTMGTNCPRLRLTYMDNNEKLWWDTKIQPISSANNNGIVDGTWFDFVGDITFTQAQVASSNVYIALTIDNVEKGIDISLGDIELKLPQIELPALETSCNELILNGNGSLGSTGTVFPMTSFVKNEATLSLKTESENNSYFHLSGRTASYSSLTTKLNPQCTIENSYYIFSSKIRVHSTVGVTVKVLLRRTDAQGNAVHDQIITCDPSSGTWINCGSEIKFTKDHETSSKLELLFVTIGDSTSNIDYDDISIQFKSSGDAIPVLKESNIGDCWSTGSQMLITSDTRIYDTTIERTIDAVNAEQNSVSSTESYLLPLSIEESEYYAGEIALLSRNILFKGDDTSTSIIGNAPHLVIYHTPNVTQILDGIQIDGFGLEGTDERFPISFHMSNNIGDGSVVSRNSIVNSKQRCVVVKGTNGLLIKDNICYNNIGHGYVLEDGGEINNIFEHNLGAVQTKSTNVIAGATDSTPATFYIRSPENTFVNNVAAGSFDSGFWLHFGSAVIGESSNQHIGYIPTNIPMTKFNGNVVHSSRYGIKSWPSGYTPDTVSLIENTKLYRNVINVYLYNVRNIHFNNIHMADAKISFDSNMVNGLTVSNATVVGVSTEFQQRVSAHNYYTLCTGTSQAIIGMKIPINGKQSNWEDNLLDNITFENFSDNIGCLNNQAIQLNPVVKDLSYTTPTKLNGLTFDNDIPSKNKFTMCDLETKGVNDIVMSIDNDSLLDTPSTNLTASGGVIVSRNNVQLLALMENCIDLPTESCGKFCTGVGSCMRTITITTEPQSSIGVVLKIVESNNTTEAIIVESSDTSEGTYKDTMVGTIKTYSVSLPTGTYVGQFVYTSNDGEIAYPKNIKLVEGPIPACNGYYDSFTLQEKPPAAPEGGATTTDDECLELIPNNDFDHGDATSSGWLHNGGGLKYVSPGSSGNGNALQTSTRTKWYEGQAIYLHKRCFNEVGKWYKFSALVRLWYTNGGYAHCEASVPSTSGYRCPRANIKTFNEQGNTTSIEWYIGNAVGPWTTGGWNILRGTFQLTQEMIDASEILLFIDNVRPGVEMQLDSVHLIPYVPSCPSDGENLALNGDLEDNNYEYWDFLGSTKLSIKDGGSNGSSYGIKGVTRPHWFHGMLNEINTGCLVVGAKYLIEAKYKIETLAGEPVQCTPTNPSVTTLRCPAINIRMTKPDNTNIFQNLVAKAIAPLKDDVNEWNIMSGTFEYTEEMDSMTKVEFFFNGAWKDLALLIDDVTLTTLPDTPYYNTLESCDDLILNGDFNELQSLRHWDVRGLGGISLENNSESNYYIRNSLRTALWFGANQELTKRSTCMGTVGETWIVEAKFQLINPATNDITVDCDPSITWGTTQCPALTVMAYNDNGSYDFTILRNTIEPAVWNKDVWNPFMATFVTTQAQMNLPKMRIYIDQAMPNMDVLMDDIKVYKSTA